MGKGKKVATDVGIAVVGGLLTGGTGSVLTAAVKRVAASKAIEKAFEYKYIILMTAAVFFLFIGSVMFVVMFSFAEDTGILFDFDGFLGGTPSTYASETIPPNLLPIYQEAEKRYGVAWNILAAINSIETSFGTNLSISSCGAVGWMQFMPTTWSGGSNPNAVDSPDSPLYDTDPQRIAQYGGYGVDGDGDGKADPYNPADAIFSAAYLLQKNGYQKNPEQAIYQYNHDYGYVKDVMELAMMFASMRPNINGSVLWPLPGQYTYISSPFGTRADPFTKVITEHEGIDLPAPEGTPVFVVADGQVIYAGWDDIYGNCVQIKHDGYVTLYGHLSEISVESGDIVSTGFVLGKVGDTGRSTGPHLHFGVMVNYLNIDPLTILGKG